MTPSFVNTPDQTAVDLLARMPAVEKEVWAGLLPEVKALTFTIKLTQETDDALKKAEAMRVMQRAKALIESLPAGGDYRKVQKQIAADLSPYFPTPAQASRRAELLVRHWAGMIRNAAWYRTLDRQRTAYPYWKYVTFGDDRVRETHEALNGKIVPADSPFWDTHFPPWAPMCRCMVVPVTQAEYDRIKAKEKALPMEQRSIVEGPALEALEKNNTIMTARKFRQADGSVRHGPPTPFPVAPDPGWNGWNPKDLRITHEALTDRYATRPGGPQALQQMMDKAEKVKLTPDITLADHIRGLPDGKRLPAIPLTPAGTPVSPPPVAPTPAAVPATPAVPAVRPASAAPADQVAARLDPPKRGVIRDACQAATDAIASVHSDGGLGLTPVEGITAAPHHGGAYRQSSTRDRLAADPRDIDTRITVNRAAADKAPINTILHETGHKIDYEVIETRFPGRPATVHNAPAKAIRDDIHTALASTGRARGIATDPKLSTSHRDYMLAPEELFARGYAHYITTRSAQPDALTEYDRLRNDPRYALNTWADDDFSPAIILLYDALFRALGWLL